MKPNWKVTASPFSFHSELFRQLKMSLGSISDLVGSGRLLFISAAVYFFFSDLFLSSQTNLILNLFVCVCYLSTNFLQKIVALQFVILSPILFILAAFPFEI